MSLFQGLTQVQGIYSWLVTWVYFRVWLKLIGSRYVKWINYLLELHLFESIFKNGLHPVWRQRVNFKYSCIFHIVIMKVQDVDPKEVVSGPIHGLEVRVVVCEGKCLFTNHTVNRPQFWKIVRVGLLLAVLVWLLMTPEIWYEWGLFSESTCRLNLLKVKEVHTHFPFSKETG